MTPPNQLTRLLDETLPSDVVGLQRSFANHLERSLAKDRYSATPLDLYKALAYAVRDRLVERWIAT